jgi:hypothetical protein
MTPSLQLEYTKLCFPSFGLVNTLKAVIGSRSEPEKLWTTLRVELLEVSNSIIIPSFVEKNKFLFNEIPDIADTPKSITDNGFLQVSIQILSYTVFFISQIVTSPSSFPTTTILSSPQHFVALFPH